MIVRRCAEFHADFPDDGVVEGDWYVRQPGRNMAGAIADVLSDRRHNVSGPIFAGDHGWELHVLPARRLFWMQFQGGYDGSGTSVLLMTEDRSKMFKAHSWPPDDAYPALLRELHAIVSADPRFSRLRWFNFDKRGGEQDHGTEPVSEA